MEIILFFGYGKSMRKIWRIHMLISHQFIRVIVPVVQNLVEKIFCLTYNILNKEADTIVHTYPFPAKYCTENSTFTLPERGCYFLCVKFRMATISKAVLTIRLNSSYVLIKTASFLQGSETEVFTPYRLPG